MRLHDRFQIRRAQTASREARAIKSTACRRRISLRRCYGNVRRRMASTVPLTAASA
jgi:hypothetical protein